MPPSEYVVRAATASDADVLRALATDNGMFDPDDMDGFNETMGGYLNGTLHGHAWIVATDDTEIAGAAYYAPEPSPGVLRQARLPRRGSHSPVLRARRSQSRVLEITVRHDMRQPGYDLRRRSTARVASVSFSAPVGPPLATASATQ